MFVTLRSTAPRFWFPFCFPSVENPNKFSKNLRSHVVACTCNSATLEAEFRNAVGSISVGGNSPSIGGWIV